MSPVPNRDRAGEYAAKAAHLLLRQAGAAPEQRTARRLHGQTMDRTPTGPRVMIMTPRDWAAHVHWEGMIAQALRVRGADVRFLTCGGELPICDRANTWESPPPPCRTCRSYVHRSIEAHGFPWSTIREGWEGADRSAFDWPELDEIPADELLDVVDGDLPLGRLVEIPAKWFLMGASVDDDPLWPVTMRRFLRSARRVARGIDAGLDRIRPDVAVLLNGLFEFEAIAWELCRRRGIDVVTYERGFIKETLLFRRGVPACLGDVTDVWKRFADVPLTDEENAVLDGYLDDRRHGRRTIDRYWKAPAFAVPDRPANGRLVVLFSNLTWDSAVIGQGRAFASLQDWLVGAVDAFARRPDHQLVIRVHPAEVKLPGKQTREPVMPFLASRFPQLPPNVRMISPEDPTSSYPLMEAADVGLVFTSTTGLELALHGTPVIVAGRTHYGDKGFTVDVASQEEFESALDGMLADPSLPDVERARRYAYLFFFRAPVPSPGVVEHVPGLARITIDDVAELEPGRNAAVDRICDGILGGGDFMPA